MKWNIKRYQQALATVATLLLALLLAGCAQSYTITINDGSQPTNGVSASGGGNLTPPAPCNNPGYTCGTPPAILVPTNAPAPTATPLPLGYTDCKSAEAAVLATMSNKDNVGTDKNPLVYPDNYIHDLCFAWTNNSTGVKYIKVKGPAALQFGEFTGPVRMLYVPSGTLYEGWTQGGWRYLNDDGLLNQWKVENLNVGLLGLICGYTKQVRQPVPAYKWDPNATVKEVRTTQYDCPYSVDQLLSGNYGTSNMQPTAAPSGGQQPTPTYMAPQPVPTQASSQPKVDDYAAYPVIFKLQANADTTRYYCGAKAAGVGYPSNVVKVIEEWPKGPGDGNYLHDGGNSGMSYAGFCKGGAPNGQAWELVLLTAKGFEPASFPLK